MTDRSPSGAEHALWHPTLDAIGFRPDGHDGLCFVHRLAFRTLIGRDPDPSACMDWFGRERDAFAAAASAKIRGRRLPRGENFHLTSRDIARESRPVPG